MKLDWFRLENFGMYGSKRFEFDGQPLVLVYGLNEAGKTTALNGLRQALFGFDAQSPYLTGATMAAEVQARLSDGTLIEFTRRKKQSGAFSGNIDGRRPLETSELARILGDFDVNGYKSLFGFSLDELRRGNEALKHARLSEALAGGGFGGIDRLQGLQRELRASLAELMKKSGKSGRINAKLAEIKAVHQSLESAQTHPHRLDEIRAQLAIFQGTRERCASRLDSLRIERLRLANLTEARPILLELRSVQQKIDARSVPDSIDAVFCLQWRNAIEQIRVRTAELRQEQDKLVRAEQAVAELSEPSTWLAFETTIEDLGFQAKEIRALRGRLAELELERTKSTKEFSDVMRQLGLSEFPDALHEYTLTLVQRREVERLASTLESTKSRLHANEIRRNNALAQKRRLATEQSTDSVPVALDEIERRMLVCSQLWSELDRVNKECEQVVHAMNMPSMETRLADRVCPGKGLKSNWPVPSSHEIQDFQRRLDQLQLAEKAIDEERVRLEREIEELSDSTDRLRSVGGCPSIGELDELWSKRDALIRTWLDDLNSHATQVSISNSEQASRLEQISELTTHSDDLVRKMLDTASTLAAVRENEKQINKRSSQIEQLQVRACGQRQQMDAWSDQWKTAWSGCPFDPLAPSAMLAWSDEYRSWCQNYDDVMRVERELASARRRWEESFDRLGESLPQVNIRNVAMPVLVKQVESWKNQRQSDELRAEQSRRVVEDLTELENERKSTHEELAKCQAEFQSWLASTSLPRDWKLEHVLKLTECLEHCQRVAAQVKRIEIEIAQSAAALARYEVAVQKLEVTLQLPPTDSGSETKAELWLKRLKVAREQTSQKKNHAYAIQNHRSRFDVLQSELREQELSLASLASRLGDSSHEQIEVWIQQAGDVAEGQKRKRELEFGLKAAAGKEPIDSFVEELEQHDSSSLAIRTSEFEREMDNLELQRADADQQLGALNGELLQRQNSVDALHHAHQLQILRGDLAEMSEQWIVTKLADVLLAQTIERYSKEHEPVLLRYIGEILAKLTGQRYLSVEQVNDKGGSFVVRDSQGVPWDTERLSTGTREQLYLAIRLAFIRHYGDQHEPLPVIMDDCFVNFDDKRTQYALETLLDWGDSFQTILLSCHSRMIHILSDLAPDTPVISLDSDQVATVATLSLLNPI